MVKPTIDKVDGAYINIRKAKIHRHRKKTFNISIFDVVLMLKNKLPEVQEILNRDIQDRTFEFIKLYKYRKRF